MFGKSRGDKTELETISTPHRTRTINHDSAFSVAYFFLPRLPFAFKPPPPREASLSYDPLEWIHLLDVLTGRD